MLGVAETTELWRKIRWVEAAEVHRETSAEHVITGSLDYSPTFGLSAMPSCVLRPRSRLQLLHLHPRDHRHYTLGRQGRTSTRGAPQTHRVGFSPLPPAQSIADRDTEHPSSPHTA